MEPRYLSVDQWHQRERFESRIRVQPRVEVAIMRVTIAVAVDPVPRLADWWKCDLVPIVALWAPLKRHVTAPPVWVPDGGSPETVPATLVRITSETDNPMRAE